VSVEGAVATLRLRVNVEEIGVDERDGVRPGLETVKLGMMAVAASATDKNLTSKKSFPPERREALGIEMARMHGPESQGGAFVQRNDIKLSGERSESAAARC
jgi:hypothetical protein